jgi:ribonuclease BN (tRNA processing enzyme)
MMMTRHPINTYAMCFSDPTSENRLVFTSDTGWFDELVGFCSGAQLLLVEATDYPQPESDESVQRWHLGPAEAGRLIREAKVERAIVTHYDARYSQAMLSDVRSVSANDRVVLARPHEEHLI